MRFGKRRKRSDEGVIEASERLYRDLLLPEALEVADSLTGYERDYFWALLYFRMQQGLEENFIRGLEAKVQSTVGVSDELEAMPFRQAEESTTPHEWFSRNAVVASGEAKCTPRIWKTGVGR